MDAKALLLKQTRDAYAGDDEMSLMAALEGLTEVEAAWRFDETTWTIAEILYHIAAWKIDYCQQGFGRWTSAYPKPIGDLPALLRLLDQAQQHLVECLESCTAERLDAPIATRFHGESAAHFFWIMIMHDITHASEIAMIRRAYGSRTDFNPV